jgi:putative ABC transport system permease protein
MLWLAYRNLFQNKARLVVSVGGVALALMLILALDAIFAGVERQITAYINNAGADVFVSQSGVLNLHMASSALPADAVEQVEAVPGVQSATPILYLTNMVVIGQERNLAYIIGLPPDAAAGAPWQVIAGKALPGPGEAVVDRNVARKSGVGIGDTVRILGSDLRISGLSEGTASLVNSIAFVAFEDFARFRGDSSTVSFILVTVTPGESPATVAARIEAKVFGVTAQATPAFAGQERRVVKDMGTDIIGVMNVVGFLIGMAVMALTVYTATLARRAEYGVLKALGAHNLRLYETVLAQAFYSVLLGLALGLAFTYVLSALAPRLEIGLALEMSGGSVAKVTALSLVIAGLAGILPVVDLARLDPATVFRGGRVR